MKTIQTLFSLFFVVLISPFAFTQEANTDNNSGLITKSESQNVIINQGTYSSKNTNLTHQPSVNSPSFKKRQLEHNVFLFGNLSSLKNESVLWDSLENIVSTQQGKSEILFLGDFLDKDGLEKEPTKSEKTKIDRLISLGQSADDFYFVPGDREWNNAKIGGQDKLEDLDDFLKDKLNDDRLISDDGCPGPKAVDFGENLRIIFINSHWFVHPENDRTEEQDAECKYFNEVGFWDEVEDNIKSVVNKNIIIAAHHPVYSYGQYAGYRLAKQHFLPPVIGSFVAGYHQNVGTRKDLSRAGLKSYSGRILGLMQRYPTMFYVSGHEFDLQAHYFEKDFHINSGSIARAKEVSRGINTFYKKGKKGFIKLAFYNDGSAEMEVFGIRKNRFIKSIYKKKLLGSVCDKSNSDLPINTRFYECPLELKKKETPTKKLDTLTSITVAASNKYSRGKLGRIVWGPHYRTSWETPVKGVPYLPLETLHGGLTPYETGGGGQTKNLKFKAENGREYAFRSVDKNPTRRKNKELLKGIYKTFVQDIISGQHPYGSLILAPLLDSIDIPHSSPQLFVLPDHPKLGVYQKEFAGMLGYLELKPKGKNKTSSPFKNADKVESTVEMLAELLDDNDSEIDAKSYIRTRIFDMWIADWDRHHDNWKWLAYKQEKGMLFKPFPKDRDKVFGKLQGLYGPLDWEFVVKDYAQFRDDFKGLKSLNHKARNLDRILASSMTKEDWLRELEYVRSKMTDEAIRNAIKRLPAEVHDLTAEELFEKLKSRLEKLPEAVQDYYGMLAKYVDIIGSNKREYFEVKRLKNGDVHVKVFKLKKDGERPKILMERTFYKAETDEIRLYGLDNEDVFDIRGEPSKKGILIRIISGKDKDKINENAPVSGLRRMTKVYDRSKEDQLNISNRTEVIRMRDEIHLQTANLFENNYHLILPTISYNQDDGFGFGFSSFITRQAFNKPGFGSRYTLNLSGTTKNNYSLSLGGEFRHAVLNWDLTTSLRATNQDRTFRNFYGFGNEFNLEEENRINDFYENETSILAAEIGLRRAFPHKNDNSTFSINAFYERRDVTEDPDDDIEQTIYDNLTSAQGVGLVQLPGVRFDLNLDFRDSPNFPTRGTQFRFRNTSFMNSESDWDWGGKIETDASIFITAHQIKTPITLSLRTGLHHSYGAAPFYYKSFIGQQANHRGFRRNRYAGETAAFLNSELRWHLGTINTPLVPFYVGVFGLYDIGRVWAENESSDLWHDAAGGGFYAVPYSDAFNLTFTFVRSDEEDLLFSFRVGFFVR
jgi:hypothetical protein